MKKYISLFLSAACIIFIYGNSLMDGGTSSAISNFVLIMIHDFAELIGVPSHWIASNIIRKFAHFIQFAILGFLITSTVKLWLIKLKSHIFMILFIGLFIAVSDEFLQLFIEGRSGLVQDVALDFAGFTFGMLVYIGLSLISKMTSKNSANNDK